MNCDHAGLVEGLTRKQQQYLRRGRRMASLFPKGSRFFSHVNRVVFGLTRGRIGAEMLGVPVGLLTTTGRNSGRARTVPIVYLDEGTHFLVAPSNSGLDVPPAWYLNLRAQPTAKVCTRTGTDRVVARELTGYELDEAWKRLTMHNPLLGGYQSCTKRPIPVIALERQENQGPG